MTLNELRERFDANGRMPVIYVAGPMSGKPDFNFPAFNEISRKLRLLGFPVLNPADFGEGMAELDLAPPDTAWVLAMQRDLPLVAAADAILLLDGWDLSRGAGLERSTAESLGKLIVDTEAPGDLARFVFAFLTLEEVRQVYQADTAAESARQLCYSGETGVIMVVGTDADDEEDEEDGEDGESEDVCGVPGCPCHTSGRAS